MGRCARSAAARVRSTEVHVLMDTASRPRTRVVLPLLAFACFLLEWVPSWFTGSYGYFIDEFYYLLCSQHLAFGYVDHPPFSIFLLRGISELFGDSLPALRLLPALAGAATVLVTGWIAGRLGAGPFGRALAAGAVVTVPVYQVMFGFYSMNALSILLWTLGFAVLVELGRSRQPRWWLVFGAVAGLGLENKHTFVLLALGLAVGLLVTPARRELRSPWLWVGLGIAVLMLAPNLLWQEANGWPSLEFYRSADASKNLTTPPLAVLAYQVLSMNPATLPLWLAGLAFFLVAERGRPHRHLGWIYVTLLGIMLVGQKSRPDRIAAAYPILFAGGGVLLGDLRRRWLRPALAALLLLCGAVLAPIGLPLLPPRVTAEYAAALGAVPQIEGGEGKRSALPQWLADRTGWKQLVADVEAVAFTLDPAERRRAIVFAPSYGRAAPLEVLGGSELPPIYSAHNNYFLWGPPDDPVELALVVGLGDVGEDGELVPEDPLPQLFAQIDLAAVYHCEWCMPWRDGTPIWIARGPKRPFRDVWPELKFFY